MEQRTSYTHEDKIMEKKTFKENLIGKGVGRGGGIQI